MYAETIEQFAAQAAKKAAYLRNSPVAFFVSAMMAGAYVGIGIILIMTVGNAVDPTFAKIAMGLSFGIALTLVVFAGSELFTGYTMYMTLGRLRSKASGSDLAATWSMSWLGNLAGALVLVSLFSLGGGGGFLDSDTSLIHKVAAYKMNSPALKLFARAILCNWLVCLALWTAARTRNDGAKILLIFWCLFAFITSGFEHSVANMTVLSLSLVGNHPETVTLHGAVHNLVWVTLGNIIGGAVFMAGAYWKASPELKQGGKLKDPSKISPSSLKGDIL